MHDPLTLTEAIIQVVRCDNQLFERRQVWFSIKGSYKIEAIISWKQALTIASMFDRYKLIL